MAAPLSILGAIDPPTITLGLPATAMLGSNVTFPVTFDNNDPEGETGYGPFIELQIPRTGADGAGTAADDGLGTTTISATYAGVTIPAADFFVRTFGAGGTVAHPLVRDATGAFITVTGTPGDALVVIRLPFGSFTYGQPPATVQVTVNVSNLADVDHPLTVLARGGYQYGYTALDDWCCGDNPATTLSANVAASLTPSLFALAKTYAGPENTSAETATGPNFSRSYTVSVDIAQGQPIANLTVTDVMPDNLQYLSLLSATPGGYVLDDQPTAGSAQNPPLNDLVVRWLSITGGASADDAVATFSFFVPRDDAFGMRILDPVTGAAENSCNNAQVSGTWTPVDARDAPSVVSINPAGCEHVLADRSLAVQKSVANLSGAAYAPGDVLDYTLTFQISDYFAFDQVVVEDVLSDGQHFDPSFTPTLQVDGNGYTLSAGNFFAASPAPGYTYIVDTSNIDLTDGPPPPPAENPATNGTTLLTFNVSDELGVRGQSANLVGGCVNPAGGTPDPDCSYNDGATTGVIHFHAVIQDNFTDNYPSGDWSVDQGDTFWDTATISGQVLDTDTFAPGGMVTNDARADFAIGTGVLTKSIYAINGSTSFPSVLISPGDTVTYRIRYVMPTSDEENLALADYLPLPIFYVADPDANDYDTLAPAGSHNDGPAWSFDPTVSAAAPPSGTAKFGPGDTFSAYSGIPPTLTANTANNSLDFYYGNYDNPANLSTTVDLLFTVTVAAEPFADQMYLTNQAQGIEGSTNAGIVTSDKIVQVILGEPVVTSTKGVIWTSNPDNVFNLANIGPAGVAFLAPGSAPRWTGNITTGPPGGLSTRPINSNVRDVDAGDTVTFAITIQNSGTSLKGAFDIRLKDSIPGEYQIPSGGLNLQVYYGNENTSHFGPIWYRGLTTSCVATTDNDPCGEDLFQDGIELIDSVPGEGICQVHNPNSGNDVILITYDLEIKNSVSPGDIPNTETLLHYAGEEGGPNHVEVPPTDQATVTISGAPAKYIVSTSEPSTGIVGGTERVTIGEVVRYRAVARIPESTIENFQLQDVLPAGLIFLDDGTEEIRFVSNGGISSAARGSIPAVPAACNLIGTTADATNPDLGTSIPGCTLDDWNVGSSNSTTADPDSFGNGTDVFFKLGDLTNPDRDDDGEFVVIEYNVLVHNLTANQNNAGTTRNNVLRTLSGASTPVQFGNDSPGVLVRVAEPVLSLAKASSVGAGTADAGDAVTYTVTIRNDPAAPTSSTAEAFDVDFADTLNPTYLTLVAGSINIVPSGGATGATDHSAGNDIHVTVDSMPLGSQVVVTYQTVITAAVVPSQAVDNAAEVTWTSLPGDHGTGDATPGSPGTGTGERTGENGPAGNPNHYDRTATATVRIHDPMFSKFLDSTSATHTAGADLAIGETATFGLEVTLPEGTTPALSVTDDLPDGLAFVAGSDSLVAQTSPPAVCGSLAEDFGGSVPVPALAVNPTGDLTFTFGAITTDDDNNAGNNSFLICFTALVLNDPANQASPPPLTNAAVLTVGTDTFNASQDVDIVESALQIAKAVDDANPAPDQTVTFMVFVDHAPTSGADAFDAEIRDALPADLALDLSSVTIAPAGGVSGIVNHSAGNTIDLTIDDFPLGGSLTLSYQAQVTASFGTTVNNTATVTWTSLPGTDTNERTGTDGVGGALNDYAADSSAPITSDRNLAKSLTGASAPAPLTLPDVTLGEILEYQLVLTIPPDSSDTYIVVDTLDSGLAFVDCADYTAGADLTSSAVDLHAAGNCTPGTMAGSLPLIAAGGAQATYDFGTVTNSSLVAPETIVINYRVVVLDVAASVGGVTTLRNSAEMTWPAGSIARQTAPVNVLEPLLDMEKTVDISSATPGMILTYTIRVFHTPASQMDAYDVAVSDTLPLGVQYVPGSLQAVSGTAPDALDDTAVDPVTGQPILTGRWADLPAGGESIVQFQARFGIVPVGTVVTNTASAEWTSLPGDVPAPPAGYLSAFNQPYSHERRYDPLFPADTYRTTAAAGVSAMRLPDTGFAPGRVTPIPPQPPNQAYAALNDMRLEIPVLQKALTVLGIPIRGGRWDLSWLWNNAGYLDGTAFPGTAGNSVITAHVYLPTGLPGPFASLGNLRWGDKVILHNGGIRYTYEVRVVERVLPSDNSVMCYEDLPWLTLMTCQGYNPFTGYYSYRTVVRAVLIRTESE